MKTIISIALCLSIFFAFVGCAKNKEPDEVYSNVKNDITKEFSAAAKLDFSDAGELSHADYKQKSNIIESVSIGGVLAGYENLFYTDFSKTYDQLFQIGISGVPVLVDKIDFLEQISTAQDSENFAQRRIYAKTLCFIMRLEEEFLYDISTVRNEYKTDNIKTYYFELNDYILNTINSDIDMQTKALKLAKCGYFALPYVVKELEKGHKEYAEFFPYVGIHLTTEEWAARAENNRFSMASDKYTTDYDEIVILKESFEIIKRDYEDFDYKDWLSENEDDLNMVFKFLDEFCAEYEAEQNK